MGLFGHRPGKDRQADAQGDDVTVFDLTGRRYDQQLLLGDLLG